MTVCPTNTETPRPPRIGARIPITAILVLGAVGSGEPAYAQAAEVDGTSDADAAAGAASVDHPPGHSERDRGLDEADATRPALDHTPASTDDDTGDADRENGPRPWLEGVQQETSERARDLFLEGNTLMKDGLFAQGAARYQEAIALWDHPAFHYNLAIAQINLDQPIAAHASFRRALRWDGRALPADRIEQAESFLTLLRNQLARVEVSCAQPGAVVTLDGTALFTAPGRATVMARPGSHQLMADQPGHLPDTRQIVLEPGQHVRHALAPALPSYVTVERRWPAWVPWTVTGAGLALAAGAAALDWRSAAAFERHDRRVGERCAETRGCQRADIPPDLAAQRQRAQNLQWAARATYAVGGAVLVTGAVLLYLNREHPVEHHPGQADELRREPRPEGAPRVTAAPWLGPDAAGVAARLRF